MTNNQLKQVQDFIAGHPGYDFRVTFNYYTKLPALTLLLPGRGGINFTMYRRTRYEEFRKVSNKVELEATIDHTTHGSQTGMIVSGAHNWDQLPKANHRLFTERVSLKRYLEFVDEVLELEKDFINDMQAVEA